MKAVCSALFVVMFLLLPANSSFSQDKSANENKIAQIKHSESRVKFDPSRNPAKDLKAAIKEAKKQGKNILLDVGGEWCIWCHRLDKLFEDNKDLADFEHENFIVMKVNYSKENKNEKFLNAYPKVEGYPHLFVLDSNGKLLRSQNTGDLENGQGGHDKDKVMSFLKDWAPKKKS